MDFQWQYMQYYDQLTLGGEAGEATFFFFRL
jgi:hypothetical protein